MENGDKTKDKKIITIKAVSNEPQVVKYSTIKRMLGTLDRFLTQRSMFIIAFCTAMVSLSTIGLVFTNTIFGNASSGSSPSASGNLTFDTWLWSFIAVFGFLAIVVGFYALGRRKAERKATSNK